MSVMFRYILTMFARNALLVFFGLSGIFIVFDVLANAGEVTRHAENIVETLWSYIRLSLPAVIVLLMPMVAFLATLMTMHVLLKNMEMVVIGALGSSIYQIVIVLASGGIVLAALHFAVAEYLASESSPRLRQWAENNYRGQPPAVLDTEKMLWAASEQYIVHYRNSSLDGRTLYNPMLIYRTDNNLIATYIRARRAVFVDPGWRLDDAHSKSSGNSQKAIERSLTVDLKLRPEDFSLPSRTFGEMPLAALWQQFIADNQSDNIGDLQQLWLHRKMAQPLGTVVMTIIAASLGLFMGRRYNAILINSGFIAFGFCFLFAEKLFLSWGESHVLPPFLAGWAPLLIFGSLGGWFLLHRQE